MFIYRIINNINGKIYIGMDSGPVDKHRRWIVHCRNHLRPKVKDYEKVLYRAMRKYGINNFTYDVLEECLSVSELKERETHWINELNSTTRGLGGYNQTVGGEGGSFFSFASKEERERLSKIISDRNNFRWETLGEEE